MHALGLGSKVKGEEAEGRETKYQRAFLLIFQNTVPFQDEGDLEIPSGTVSL